MSFTGGLRSDWYLHDLVQCVRQVLVEQYEVCSSHSKRKDAPYASCNSWRCFRKPPFLTKSKYAWYHVDKAASFGPGNLLRGWRKTLQVPTATKEARTRRGIVMSEVGQKIDEPQLVACLKSDEDAIR